MGIAGAGLLTGCKWWPDAGLWNPCFETGGARSPAHDALLKSVWDGIDPADVRDCHVHLVGTGDGGSGIWINPDLDSVWHPLQSLQKRFYLNAACVDNGDEVDSNFVARLTGLLDQFPDGVRLMLLALDYYHDAHGERSLRYTSFHTPNEYP